jgi:agmatinase
MRTDGLQARPCPGHRYTGAGRADRRELLDAVRRICLELPVVGMDVVEVAPPYDHADITAPWPNRVVLEALSAIARKRRDERDGTRWDPALRLLSERAAPNPEAGPGRP